MDAELWEGLGEDLTDQQKDCIEAYVKSHLMYQENNELTKALQSRCQFDREPRILRFTTPMYQRRV